VDLFFNPDIGIKEECLPAFFPDQMDCFIPTVAINIRDDDARTVARKPASNGASGTEATGTCHNNYRIGNHF
jgi:hypothetical protein